MRVVACFWGICLSFLSLCTASSPAVVKIEKDLTAILLQREIYLEITASPSKSRIANMSLYVESPHRNSREQLIKKGFRSKSPVYRVPWDHLSCQGKTHALKSLFPSDSLQSDGWHHTVVYGGLHGETLWRISTWFTGSGNNCNKIARLNNLQPQKLAIGSKLVVPLELLSPCFTQPLQYPVRVGELNFQQDPIGVYAEYTLLSGQTIYSLVLKFTPRMTAKEVLSASELILKRSNLKDFKSIPSNTVLKIPADLISPQYLPPNDPRRMQFEETDRESSQFKPHEKAKALDGVTVILDAGHGGVDPGAIGIGSVKEDEYAYDVMCRVKRKLEKDTKARVFVTIEDTETGFAPRDSKILSSGLNKEYIRTNPSYLIKNSGVALNLRWMLVNYIYLNSSNAKSRAEKVVFTSFHADSLHSNAQGLMVYIPGADYYSGNLKKTDKVYLSRKEAKNGGNAVSSTRKDRLQAEGYSAAFAEHIRNQCDQNGLKMHSNQPVRKFVIRNRKGWVPSILRYSKVPTRVLIELANLQNPTDVQKIKDPKHREALAEIYVNALIAHFAE